MSTKRYRPPEVVLQRAIDALEHEDPAIHEQAVIGLLKDGPLLVSDRVLQRPQDSPIVNVRAELLQFLRSIVRGRPRAEVGLDHPATFAARIVEGRVQCEADGDGRDLVLLQVVLLLQFVGLQNIRVCPAPHLDAAAPPFQTCDRLFVKTYRREYCSSRCQKRAYMRQRRANERATRIRTRQRRQRKGV